MSLNQELVSDNFSVLLRENPEQALHSMYQKYYSMLCYQVMSILKDRSISEDIVQEVFLEIWKKREELVVQQSIEGYLKRACRNRTLNYIRDNHVKWEDESSLAEQEDTGFTFEQYLSAEELNLKINNVIAELPDKCGVVFSLSRFEDMSYAEIAKELSISVKTVENQISKALKILRREIYKKSSFE
ncbi:MAG TPA: RNA polymerase sigma-70 factor [Saprospiraceae bacterium]|nr:RNA polymerase sigma-70 factor [Saprospiraceae bacterium]